MSEQSRKVGTSLGSGRSAVRRRWPHGLLALPHSRLASLAQSAQQPQGCAGSSLMQEGAC